MPGDILLLIGLGDGSSQRVAGRRYGCGLGPRAIDVTVWPVWVDARRSSYTVGSLLRMLRHDSIEQGNDLSRIPGRIET
jgi:hypothetical protein